MNRDGEDLFDGGGEVGARMQAIDWAATPLGPVETWPQSLRTAVRIVLTSRYAMWMGWGPDLIFLYNDAYAHMTLGPKHPWALGRSAREVWAEIWGDIGPRIQTVLATGTATWDEALLLFLERSGYPEESYHTFSYSPLPDDAGRVSGMLCVVTEETERVIGERRLQLLREIAAHTSSASTAEGALEAAAEALATDPHDFPFAALYLADAPTPGGPGRLRRVALAGISPDDPACCPDRVALGAAPDADADAWPLARALDAGAPTVIKGLAERADRLPSGPWERPPECVVMAPLARQGQPGAVGLLVAGLNPHRPYDDDAAGFVSLVAGQVATAVARAQAYEEERRRAEALAELDRAKTAFFQNVSHEFRTPLTLLLGPLEDVLAGAAPTLDAPAAGTAGPLPPDDLARVEVAHRNALRLLRLVNGLLEFSRIEAGRVEAAFAPTDLSALTADLASTFRSATERAGLTLTVDAPPLGERVYVDRRMWETVVLNLLSNAFKHTFVGGLRVGLHREDGPAGPRAVLSVADTGTGIPAAALPHLFERFRRVEGARARSYEGTGIGLALVQELARLHGGEVTVESVEAGRGAPGGTTFRVAVPLGVAHLPADHLAADPAAPTGATARADAFVEEALRWLPDSGDGHADEPPAPHAAAPADLPADGRPRVLVADDNADMRAYVARLLAPLYRVEAVADGAAALEAAVARPPDLVLADVMMPNLDGFGLLAALRAEHATRTLPVVLLSARAGEEARVEGLEAGADDYLVKPFAARELVARVGAHLELARLRREATEERERLLAAAEAARVAAEQAAERTARLQAVTAALAGARTTEEVAAALVEQGRAALGADTGALMLLDPDGTALDLVHAVGQPAEIGTRWGRVPLDMAIPVTDAVRTGRPVWLESADGEAAARYPAMAAVQAVSGSRAFAALPLLVGGRAVGALTLGFLAARSFAPEERAVAVALAAQAALALDRARAEEALRTSEARARLAVDVARLGAWRYSPDDDLVHYDERMLAIWGLPPDTVALPFDEAVAPIHPDDRDSVVTAVLAALDPTGTGHYAIDYRVVWPSGEVRWVAANGQAQFSGTGLDRHLIGLVGTALDATARKRAEAALRESNETLERRVAERTADVRGLSAALTMAEQRERERLSHVLHDDLQQVLFGLQLRTHGLVGNAPPDLAAEAESIYTLAREAVQTTRSLAIELAPPVLRGEGLAEALRWLAAHAGQAYRLDINVAGVEGVTGLNDEERTLLFQVARELLLNVAKHAGTDQAFLSLRREDREVVLEVADRGLGFSPDGPPGPADGRLTGGLGLASLRDRLAHRGGRLDLVSTPGEGTLARAVLPL